MRDIILHSYKVYEKVEEILYAILNLDFLNEDTKFADLYNNINNDHQNIPK